MKKLRVFFLAMVLGISGCSSVIYTTPLANAFCSGVSTGGGSTSCPDERNKIYIGARKDIEAISDTDGAVILLPIIDLPLSVVLDTVFLPYTIPYTIFSD